MVQMTRIMSDLLDKARADETPCLLGTASKDGRPRISPKGSVAVFDPQTLCFWERSGRGALANLKENPRVVVYYRNPTRAKEISPEDAAIRFYGRARVIDDRSIREKVWDRTVQAEKEFDPDKKGVAVLIDVDLIEELSGKAMMKAD